VTLAGRTQKARLQPGLDAQFLLRSHPEESRSGVSKDDYEAPSLAISWFETALPAAQLRRQASSP
jgi:hypothetical protein